MEALKPVLEQHGEIDDRVWGWRHVRSNELFAGGGSWRLGSDAKIVECGGRSNYKELSRPSLTSPVPKKNTSSGFEVSGS